MYMVRCKRDAVMTFDRYIRRRSLPIWFCETFMLCNHNRSLSKHNRLRCICEFVVLIIGLVLSCFDVNLVIRSDLIVLCVPARFVDLYFPFCLFRETFAVCYALYAMRLCGGNPSESTVYFRFWRIYVVMDIVEIHIV